MPRRDTPPPHEPRLARIARLVAEPSRARMLCHLLGGELASASELARAASVSAATASGHLVQLLDGGLLACEPRGRHRYYRLADAEVAHALEALALVSERSTQAAQWAAPARTRLRFARSCYGHLAGRVGVALFDGMRNRGWLLARDDGGQMLSEAGATGLQGIGMDGAAWRRRSAVPGGGRVAYGCLDWSERRDHLAGPLAVALMQHLLERGWLRRREGERTLEWTVSGRRALAEWLVIDDEPPAGATPRR